MLIIVSFHQKTPLHIAVESGNDATVKFFVDKGADVNTKDNKGVRKITNHSVFGVITTVSSKYVIERRVCPWYITGYQIPKNVHVYMEARV